MTQLPPKSMEELIEELDLPTYTREQFAEDHARLLAVLAAKHGIAEHEVPELIRTHNYTHSFEDPEDEYIQIMTFARHAGWM